MISSSFGGIGIKPHHGHRSTVPAVPVRRRSLVQQMSEQEAIYGEHFNTPKITRTARFAVLFRPELPELQGTEGDGGSDQVRVPQSSEESRLSLRTPFDSKAERDQWTPGLKPGSSRE
jgi:hypothetical protein